MRTIKYMLTGLIMSVSMLTFATTWDEPWQEEILIKSESFVLLKIDSIDNEKGIWATVIKNLAGKTVDKNIHIDGFFAMRITSSSGGHGPQFRLPAMDTAYFFLVQGENKNYQMPTPTSGFAWKKGNKVSATYRISMHKAMAYVDMYEKTMSELFNFIRTHNYDKDYFEKLFTDNLTKDPGKVDGTENERELFFKQHIALESFYYFGDRSYFNSIIRFLDSEQIHNQISGIRALSKINTTTSKQKILDFIRDDSKSGLARVLAIQALRRLDARELTKYLEVYLPNASTEWVGFGLDIMDVRNGVIIPENLKSGIEELLKEWKK